MPASSLIDKVSLQEILEKSLLKSFASDFEGVVMVNEVC